MKRWLFISLLLSSYDFKSRVVTSIFGYIISKASNLNISLGSLSFNRDRVYVDSATIKNLDGDILAEIERVTLSIDFNNFSLREAEVEGADIYISFNSKRSLNWAKLFESRGDSFESRGYFIPNLGEVKIRDSRLHFKDSYFNLDRELDSMSGSILFDHLNQKIYINTRAVRNEESYGAMVTVDRDMTTIDLNLGDVIFDRLMLCYIDADDVIYPEGGRMDAELKFEIYHQFNEIITTGRLSLRDLLVRGDLFDFPIYITDGEFEFSEPFAKGFLNSSIDGEAVTFKLLFDFDYYRLSMFTELNVNMKYILNSMPLLESYSPFIEGRSRLAIKSVLDVNRRINSIEIDLLSLNTKIFDDHLNEAKLSMQFSDLTRLSKLDASLTFEYGDLNVDLSSNKRDYLISTRGISNLSFLQYFGLSLPKVKCQFISNSRLSNNCFEGRAEAIVLDAMLRDQKIKVRYKNVNDTFTLYSKNSNFKVDLFKDMRNFSFVAHFDDFYIKNGQLSSLFDGNLKISGRHCAPWVLDPSNLDIKFRELSLNGVDILPFTLKSNIINNKFIFTPIDIVGEVGEYKISIPHLILEGILDSDSAAVSLYLFNSSIYIDSPNFKELFNNFVLSLNMSSEGILFKKISTDKFFLTGGWSSEGLLMDAYLNSISLLPEVVLESLNVKIEGSEIHFTDGSLSMFDSSLPITALILGEDDSFHIKYLILGDSYIEGYVGRELSLKVNVAFDRYLNEYLRRYINQEFILTGDLSIIGSYSNPILIGDLFFTLPDIDLIVKTGVSYRDSVVSGSSLVITKGEEKISMDLYSYFNLNSREFEFILNEQSRDLSGILFDQSGMHLYLKLSGEGDKYEYKCSANLYDIKYRELLLSNILLDLEGDGDRLDLLCSIRDKLTSLNLSGKYYIADRDYELNVKSDGMQLKSIFSQHFLDHLDGLLVADIKIINNSSSGFIKLVNTEVTLNLQRYMRDLNATLAFSNLNAALSLKDSNVVCNVTSVLNQGRADIDILFNIFEYSWQLSAKLREVLLELRGYFAISVDSDIFVEDSEINADMTLLEGRIFDIYNYKSEANSSSTLKLKRLSLQISDHGVDLYLNTFFSLDKIDANILGRLIFEDGTLEGEIYSKKGLIEYNSSDFKLDKMSLSFSRDKRFPDIIITATTNILGSDLFFGLEGNLGWSKFRLIDSRENYEFLDNTTYISLWSKDNLDMEDIIYLLARTDSDRKLSSGFIGNQLGTSLLLNPISRKVKDFLGFQQFKIKAPFFDLNNFLEGNYNNPFSYMKIELATNIYKSTIFGGVNLSFSESGSALESMDINLFTINKWIVSFSFYHPFDNIVFSGLGIFKSFIWKKHEFGIGFSNLESIFLNSYSKIGYNVKVSMRF